MREIVDPYKGMKYSDIVDLPENRKTYRENPSPVLKVPGTGLSSWDASIGRHVV
jgi:hypothetical protein